jgi:hypothetical protein
MSFTHTIPLWLRAGNPNDDSFFFDPRRKCIGQRHLFFSPEPEDFAQCRALCASCPVFKQCARYGVAHFADIPYGVMFGLSENQRHRIDDGVEIFWDWRRGWNHQQYTARVARAVATREREHGESKRERNQDDIPDCPRFHFKGYVRRAGRDPNTDRQRYRCQFCGAVFLGEDL